MLRKDTFRATPLAVRLGSSSLACLITLAPALGQTELAEARSTIERLIEPSAAPAAMPPVVQATDSDVEESIRLVLRGASADLVRIKYFGQQADAALVKIIGETPLAILTSSYSSNPLSAIFRYRPDAALDFLIDVETSNPELHQLMLGRGYTAARLIGEVSEAQRPKLEALVGRILSSDSGDGSENLSLAFRAVDSGLDVPTARELLLADIEEVARKEADFGGGAKTLRELIEEAHGDDWAGAGPASVNVMLDGGKGLHLLGPLAKSRFADVRSQVVVMAAWALSEQKIPTEVGQEILFAAMTDESLQVRQTTVDRISTAQTGAPLLFDLPQLSVVLDALTPDLAIEDATIESVATNVLARLEYSKETSRKEIDALLTKAFSAADQRVGLSMLRLRNRHNLSESASTAWTITALNSGLVAPQEAKRLLERLRPQDRPGEWSAFVEALVQLSPDSEVVGDYTRVDIQNVHPDLVPAFLAWLGQTGPEADRMAAFAASWLSAPLDTFRRSALNANAPARERALACGAWARQPGVPAEDAQRLVEVLGELLRTDSTREDAVGALRRMAESGRPPSSPWAGILVALARDPSIPSTAISVLPLNGAARTEQEVDAIGSLIDAVHERYRQDPEAMDPGNVGYFALETANGASPERDILAGHMELVLEWAKSRTYRPMCVTYAVRRNPGALHVLLDGLLTQLAVTTNVSIQKGIVDDALRIPLEDAVPRVLEATRLRGGPDLLTYVDARVGEMVRIRDIERRWRSAGADTADDAAATLAVLELLKSGDEAVRIEAIRGLGTLGATSSLPRLIEIVGSGSAAEKAAAKSTLDLLHRRAAQLVLQAEAK